MMLTLSLLTVALALSRANPSFARATARDEPAFLSVLSDNSPETWPARMSHPHPFL